MDQQAPSYRREFFKSKYHAWLGLATMGAGFLLSADRPLFLLVGVAAYVLGWIYLPDMPFFRRSVDRRIEEAQQAEASKQLADFQKKRDAQLNALSSPLRKRYFELSEVCNQIEKASTEGSEAESELADPRMRRLDELMWTFLRLLGLQETLERFLETERREELPSRIQEAEAGLKNLSAEIDALKKQPASSSMDSKQRLLESRKEALEVLRKRQDRVEQAQSNLALVSSEEERLENQIKLIRADAVAAKNATSISARIDATVEHLDQTNKWLAEIGEFQDLVGDMPTMEGRLGYRPVTPPPIQPAAPPIRKQTQ